MKPKVLVTGGHGFIGMWVLRELLCRDCEVVVLDLCEPHPRWANVLGDERQAVEFVCGDLSHTRLSADLLDARGISHVIHLVGLLTAACQQDPVRGGEVNVLGMLRLFDLVRGRPDRIQGCSYASSYAVHGPTGGTQTNPETFYGVFKRTTEMIAEQYWRHFGIASVGLRPYVVYGAGRETGISAAPSLAARAVALDQPYAFGFSGQAGLVYVEDVARAFVRAALETPPGAHAVDMPGVETSVEDVIRILDTIQPGAGARLSVAGPPLPRTQEENPFLMQRLFADWQDTPLEEGLRKTVEAWRVLEQRAAQPRRA